MTLKKFHIMGLLFLALNSNLVAKIHSVYDVQNKIIIPVTDFYSHLSREQYVVMGEFHNDSAIQSAEGEIIENVSKKVPGTFKVSLMWEFLDFTDQEKIADNFLAFKENQIDSKELITNTAGDQNLEYIFMMEAIKNAGGELFGLNLPRNLKQIVIKNGLESIDKKLVPDSHYLGGKNYYNRFSEAMGGHLPSSKLDAYFLAQSLTDSVMAHHIYLNQRDLNFIVAGSFHTDFFDGTVEKLKNANAKNIALLKLVNVKNLTIEEKSLYMNGDNIYGAFANYIVFCEE